MKAAIVEGLCPTLMPEGPIIERKILGPDVNITMYGSLQPEDYAPALEDADALIIRPGAEFPREMMLSMKKARVIVVLGVGYDNIPLDLAAEKGILVCNIPDYCTKEVADVTVAMIMAHQRKVSLFNYSCGAGTLDWDWRINIPILSSSQARVGIIGLGRIGTAVALRLKPFGYKISFYDPYLPETSANGLGLIKLDRLEELIISSDIVTIHTPLTRETEGMINEKFLAFLKSGAILINTARGKIFQDTQVIYKSLKERPQLRIGSDVWPDEPPLEHPLLTAWKDRESWLADRLILCPHTAFYSEESLRNLRVSAAKIVKKVFDGAKPDHVVDPVKETGV
ncbi:MAG: C-terminal binding protein [Candidatus Omnitrophica bacterium]|nr:C-terminal binding protein [Candidatus Omnitrophota bacterium]